MKTHEKASLTMTEAVSKYHIGFRLQPGEAAVVSGRIVQMICRLELSGHHGGRIKANGARCEACIQVLESLFELLDALRSIERETLKKAGGACETRGHFASTAAPGHKVILGLQMVLRPPLKTASDSWAWIFLQRMRLALTELGCEDRAEAEPLGCRRPLSYIQRAPIGRDTTVSEEVDKESCLIA
jgi:hypothetical protein